MGCCSEAEKTLNQTEGEEVKTGEETPQGEEPTPAENPEESGL